MKRTIESSSLVRSRYGFVVSITVLFCLLSESEKTRWRLVCAKVIALSKPH